MTQAMVSTPAQTMSTNLACKVVHKHTLFDAQLQNSTRLFQVLKHGSDVLLTQTVRDLLRQNADPNYRPSHVMQHGISCLGMAAARCEPQVVNLLLEHGASVTHTFTVGVDACSRRTALHEAVANYVVCNGRHFCCKEATSRCRHVKTLRQLVDAGADVNAVDGQGDTALHIAARSLFVNAVDFLLRHDADPLIPNHRSVTALQELLDTYDMWLERSFFLDIAVRDSMNDFEYNAGLWSDDSDSEDNVFSTNKQPHCSVLRQRQKDSVACQAVIQKMLCKAYHERRLAVAQGCHSRLAAQSILNTLNVDCFQAVMKMVPPCDLKEYVQYIRGSTGLNSQNNQLKHVAIVCSSTPFKVKHNT